MSTRRSDTADRWPFAVALALAIVFHAVVLIALLHWTRAQPVEATAFVDRTVMQLRLIDVPAAPLPPMPPLPTPLPSAPAPERTALPTRTPATDGSVRAQAEASAGPSSSSPPSADSTAPVHAIAGDEVRLFHSDGSVLLPIEQDDPNPAAFGSRKREVPFAVNPMVHRSPLPYEPTMFEHVWDAQDDEPFLVEWIKNAVTETTWKKSWDTEGGTRITCGVILVVGGCSWGRSPRVTIEELKRMRADPPMRRLPPTDDEVQPEAGEQE